MHFPLFSFSLLFCFYSKSLTFKCTAAKIERSELEQGTSGENMGGRYPKGNAGLINACFLLFCSLNFRSLESGDKNCQTVVLPGSL